MAVALQRERLLSVGIILIWCMCCVEGLFAVEVSASMSEPIKVDHSLCTQVLGVKFCK